MTQPAPGWYPDPSDPAKKIYWDGTAWSAPVVTTSASSPGLSRQRAVAIGVCVLVGIGLVMSMQSVSLLTGSGPIWTGVGVVGAGVAVAFLFGAAKWVRVVAAIILALALVNALYIENQMSNKRDELSHIFDD
jgi:hypothetical protein